MKLILLLIASVVGMVSVQGQLQVIPDRPKRPCTGAKAGDTISVHYSGYIDASSATGEHDKMFDSSLKRAEPFQFKLGAGQVIRGWDEG